ncbi:Small integral membrane protein 13 [Bagarius yarrelli]|uniref:Small integral membrane protein 13 n=1 Tax=Bagarius yarrelli TaxID=175774 RepID=A0A556TVI0_BAGYA|nr:Small integral membrane protein 13 [Bagarius yarrelli]
MWQSLGLTALVIVATLLCVLLFMLFGWYVVWQLFLSKFKFLRELVGDTGSPQTETEPSESESERSSPPTPRHRTKPTRQRVAFPSSTT